MVGDAVDLAAKTLCPMDHTPPPNLLDDQSLYVRIPEPRLTDDELAAVRSIIADRNSKAIAEPSRAEGTQHADAPGEVSSGPLAAEPSPGEPSDEPVFKCTDLSCECQTDDRYLRSAPPPERPVSQEDLSAHIYAIANMCIIRRNDRAPRMADVCDEIATDLLSDYTITKK